MITWIITPISGRQGHTITAAATLTPKTSYTRIVGCYDDCSRLSRLDYAGQHDKPPSGRRPSGDKLTVVVIRPRIDIADGLDFQVAGRLSFMNSDSR